MLICVDHGNKNVKTGRCAPFTSGLVESETQPFGADVLKYGAGDLTVCDSLENGVILLYNRIRSKVRSDLDILISETEIDAILMGAEAEVPDEAVRIAEASAQEFITNLLNTLREHQIELKTGRAVFVGGGALLLRSQIIKSGKVSNPIFVEDIAANAKGYEFLYQRGHGGR